MIELARKGDYSAFEAMVRQYQKPIFNVVYRMLHNAEDAKDVTQATFLKTFENLDRYDPSRKFFSWICRIAINEAINRQASTRPQLDIDEYEQADRSNPGDAVFQDEMHRRLETALMSLSSENRSIVVLKHIAGLSYHEISESLEITEKTVKSRLFSARHKLREKLKRDECL
jgi:RNA polymerase sigma-70 factor (ECF subfamily)